MKLATRNKHLYGYWFDARDPDEFDEDSPVEVDWWCRRHDRYRLSIAEKVRLQDCCPRCEPPPPVASGSKIEQAIRAGLGEHYEDIWCDVPIFVPDYEFGLMPDMLVFHPDGHQVIVEYDGSRFHRGNLAKDHRRNEQYRSLGFEVVRIREKPLDTIGPFDFTVPVTSHRDLIGVSQIVDSVVDKIEQVASSGRQPCDAFAGQPDSRLITTRGFVYVLLPESML